MTYKDRITNLKVKKHRQCKNVLQNDFKWIEGKVEEDIDSITGLISADESEIRLQNFAILFMLLLLAISSLSISITNGIAVRINEPIVVQPQSMCYHVNSMALD